MQVQPRLGNLKQAALPGSGDLESLAAPGSFGDEVERELTQADQGKDDH
jgi:hypothetical protein